jgi:hypothetical protein
LKSYLYLCFAMLTIIFYAFLAYILYKLVFGFIIPVYRTYRRVKRGFRDMQERMGAHQPGGQPVEPQPSGRPGQGSTRPRTGEYIDFEEIK